MIKQKEISKYALANKVQERQIEKDYVLSWVLFGISQHPVLFESLIFKGGTVLKKCYFEDYRFSEDLDFTLINDGYKHEDLMAYFEEVFAWVKEEANITLQFKSAEIHTESGSSVFYVDFIGPLGGNIGSRDIKIDVTRGEVLQFEPVQKSPFITYSDMPEDSFTLNCYPLEEVLIEKMAALMGRTEARDLYDFWYLTTSEQMRPKALAIEFEAKAKHKKHNPSDFKEKLLKKEPTFRRDWAKKLENQIHDLPDFENVMREVKKEIRDL